MGFFSSTKDLFIARPDDAKAALIWKVRDQNIPTGAQLTVDSDEMALFFRDGVCVGRLAPGRHTLDTANVPFLSHLVNRVTGGNVFIAEIFFVSLREFVSEVPRQTLGKFQDAATHIWAPLEVSTARFTLLVTDPQRLLVELGGQRAGAGKAVLDLVADRLVNGIRESISTRIAESVSAMDLIGNLHSSQIGAEVLARYSGEFSARGLKVERFVRLDFDTDPETLGDLKAYHKRISEQDLDMRKAAGMSQIAGSYATYQLASGQGDALRGLGEGLAQGGSTGPMLGTAGLGIGLGLGASVAGMMGPSALTPTAYNGPGAMGAMPQVSPPPVIATSRAASSPTPTWYMRTNGGGQEGPYVPRQIALQMESRGLDAFSVSVWNPGLPGWMPASDVPAMMNELRKRQSGQQPPPPPAGMMPPPFVPPGAPPPPPIVALLFSYTDGVTQLADLPAAEVARRYKTAPGGQHYVWRAGMAAWQPADSVAAIQALIAGD